MHLINQPQAWTLLVPLKSSVRGKSRIDVDPALRRRLAGAMATDTIAAASAAPGVGAVLVVAEDAEDAERFAGIRGVRIHRTSTTGLNRAIREGVSGLTDGSGPVAVLPADLPSLAPNELGDALAGAALHRLAVVADRQSTGTTLLTAATAAQLRPHYGPDSLRRHLAVGAVLLDLPVESGLRRDVDRVDDLLGVTGSRTLAVLDSAGWDSAGRGSAGSWSGLCDARPAG